MHHSTLTGTDLVVSNLCLGGWQIGGLAFGPMDDDHVEGIFHEALDLGINFFDLAPSYGRNRAEELAGRYLPADAVIATKVGLVWDESLEVRRDLSAGVIRRQVEESLRRLRRDVIDLYLVHWPDADTPLAESFTVLEELRTAGLVRHLGVCNYPASDLAAAGTFAHLAVLQTRLNLLEQDNLTDLAWCRDHGVGFMAHSALATGLLTGKYAHTTEFSDARARFALYQGSDFQAAMTQIDALKARAESNGATLLQAALRFLLDTPGVDVAVVGTRSRAQLRGLVEEVYQWS
jgi:aryl-alcohol dehydrogenase-like predicted oxidoreductase